MLGIITKFFGSKACLKIREFLIIRCDLPRQHSESLFVHPQPELKRVVREEYLTEACRGKRVLHFGFLDSPITIDKITTGTLLHTKISAVCSSLYGIDLDPETLSDYRRMTGDMENCVMDLLQSDADISFLSNRFDIILFPEILEHLLNPGVALAKLKEILLHNPGSVLLITVPNAYSLNHFVHACNNIELVHAEHFHYFSPVTLRHMLSVSGFEQIQIMLYSHSRQKCVSPGITENGVIAVCGRKE